MSTIEIRQEMLELIKNEDDSSLERLYELFKAYKEQRRLDKMIAEGEDDIKEGKLHSQSEVQKMIESWVS
ncbi:MAG: hypothetical protein ABF257_03820 [Polaribacter sp.]